VAYRPLSDHEVYESQRGVAPSRRGRIDTAHHARELLGGVAKLAAEAGVPAELYARAGPAGPALVELAREVGADLIVVGSHGMTGFGRRLGSVPNHVTHHAPCSVLVACTAA
jgi:nucleotide-binding universal stress UspA family protein